MESTHTPMALDFRARVASEFRLSEPDLDRLAYIYDETAAPELLAALEFIAAWEPSAAPDERGGMSIIDAIDVARAALAKARSEV